MILLFMIRFVFKKKSTYLSALFAFTFLFSFYVFIDIAHYSVFNYRITGSTIYILFETNLSESIEFLKSYLNVKLVLSAILYIGIILFGVIFSSIHFYDIKVTDRLSKFKILSLISSIIICVLLLVKEREHAMPYILLKSTAKFIVERNKLLNTEITKNGSFKNVLHEENDEEETYVIIIGESTTRTHMGLYDYYRATNPLLEKKKDELYVYDNVEAPFVHTIASLGASLTIGGNNVSDKYNSTLIQLFNSAKFNTYLISNQRPIGTFDTTVTLMTKSCNRRVFTNASRSVPIKDEALLAPLQKVLNENLKKKFIIIHLMGTHSLYRNRFPVEYNVFKDQPVTKFKNNTAFGYINDYDNAVLYNDYIVNSIIDKVKVKDIKAFVLYFSDHGDEVFETKNMAGHTEKHGTPPMYQIPFVLWTSEKYKENKNVFFKKHRKYNNKNLIHTIADLSNVRFSRFDKSKSIIYNNLNDTLQ
jgi:heptose-I-phosphate ethanolaminephosphotransferase